jgi:hypothetical protein
LGFIQPPPTSCIIAKNNTLYLEASNREQRIAKRSVNLERSYYPDNKNEYLEIASNVVFERLRRSTSDKDVSASRRKSNSPNAFEASGDENIDKNNVQVFGRDSKGDRVERRASTTDESNSMEDLKGKSTLDDDAKTIDLETLREKNRPADILEYKRFMKVHSRFHVFILFNRAILFVTTFVTDLYIFRSVED